MTHDVPPPHQPVPQYAGPAAPTLDKAPGPGPMPDAPVGGYASPIPAQKTHLGHALASEWTKIRSVRSTMWTLGIMVLLVVGIGLLMAVSLSGDTYTGMPLLAGGLFGLMLGQICIVTLGVLVITSEYGTGMIRTTFTASPQRHRVLTAKAIVFFLVAFTVTTAACALTALFHSSMLSDQQAPGYAREDETMTGSIRGTEVVADGQEWFDATVGAGLYVALLGLLALAVGALLRHSAGAITTMMGVIMLPLIMALFMQTEGLRDLQEKLIEYAPLNGLASLFGIPFLGDDQAANGWSLLGVLAAVTGGMLLLAYSLLSKRDV